MALSLDLTITNAGRAALVNAANTGTDPVAITQVGISATAVIPSITATTLPGEIKRIGTLAGDVVADDTIHLVVRDESADVFTLRSFALYLSDGTLFGLYGQLDTILQKSSQAMMLLAIDVQFADIDANQLIFGDTSFLNPPATTERQGVAELATNTETTDGTDTQRVVTPKGLRAAVTSWLDTRFGVNAPSAFVKTLLASASAIALRASLGIKGAALKDEGAGKGLDADLLDGQHGAYYADVPSRLGYVPWGPANDGSGSGLDADTVDGQHASAFAQLSGATFTGPVSHAGGSEVQAANDVPVQRFHRPGKITWFAGGGGDGWSWTIGNDGQAQRYLTIDASYAGSITGSLNVLGNLTRAGAIVWHAANDGAGSGLDADLLDGKDWFGGQDVSLGIVNAQTPNISSTGGVRLRTNPITNLAYFQVVNSAGTIEYGYFVFGTDGVCTWSGPSLRVAGHLAWTAGNDGGGSGLDADLLDGQHGGFYTDIIGRLGYMPWGAPNDGAGSGLDADLLDGYDGSAYNRIVAINLSEDGGFIIYASGFKKCWGVATVAGNSESTIQYPITFDAFSNASFAAARTIIDAQDNDPQVRAPGLTNCIVYSAADVPLTGRWRAEGR